jgi:hypothetical protein
MDRRTVPVVLTPRYTTLAGPAGAVVISFDLAGYLVVRPLDGGGPRTGLPSPPEGDDGGEGRPPS